MNPIRFTIYGEAASKANSREVAMIGPKEKRRAIFRKSDKALSFEESALRQIPPAARVRLEGPVAMWLRIFYASERPDMDESIVLDVLQDRTKLTKAAFGADKQRVLIQAGVYRNDRQVRERHVYHGIDAKNPRIEILIVPTTAQQIALGPWGPEATEAAAAALEF